MPRSRWGVTDLARNRPSLRQLLPVAAVVIVGACAFATRDYLWNWRDSVTLWRHAVMVAPNNHRVHANLADALASAKRYPEAEASYREAIRLAPAFPDYHYYFGNTLARSGRVNEAVDEFNVMLKARPNDASTHDALGLALTRLGRIDEAVAQLNQAIRLDPSMASARANLGVALARKERRQRRARRFCGGAAPRSVAGAGPQQSRRALSRHGSDRTMRWRVSWRRSDSSRFQRRRLVNLGGALSRQGNGAAAASAFDRALALDPDSAEAYNGRGVLMSEQNRTAEAIAAFTKALEINPALVHVYSNRGRAYAVSGNLDAAIRDFEQILSLDPGNASAAAAIDALKRAK